MRANGLLHPGKIGPHGPHDLLGQVVFHKRRKILEVREHDRPFPALPFQGNAARKDFIPNLGGHIPAEGGAEGLPLGPDL